MVITTVIFCSVQVIKVKVIRLAVFSDKEALFEQENMSVAQ